MAKGGVEYPLARRSDIYGMFFIGLMFVGFGVSAVLIDRPNAFTVLTALFCFGFYFWLLRNLWPGFWKTAVLTRQGIQLRHDDVTLWQLPWSSIQRVVRPYKALRSELHLVHRGEVVAIIPIQNLAAQTTEFIGLLRAFLPPEVEMVAERERNGGSKAAHVFFSVVFTGLGAAMLGLSWYGITGPSAADLGSPLYQWSGYLMLAGLVLLCVGLTYLFGLLSWNRRERLPAEFPLDAGLPNNLLPYLKMHQSGIEVPPMAFAYPQGSIRVDPKKEAVQTWLAIVAFLALFGGAAIVLLIVSFGNPNTWYAAVFLALFLVAFAFFFIGIGLTYLRQIRELAEHYDEEVHLADGRIYVAKGGRKAVAQIERTIRSNPAMGSTAGINRNRLSLLVDGETRWFDPSAMQLI